MTVQQLMAWCAPLGLDISLSEKPIADEFAKNAW